MSGGIDAIGGYCNIIESATGKAVERSSFFFSDMRFRVSPNNEKFTVPTDFFFLPPKILR